MCYQWLYHWRYFFYSSVWFLGKVISFVTVLHSNKSIESKISEALINNEINHEDLMAVINEEKNIEN